MCHVASLAVMYIGLCVIQLGPQLPDGVCVGLGNPDWFSDKSSFNNLFSSGILYSRDCSFYISFNIHLAERHEFRHLVDFQVRYNRKQTCHLCFIVCFG
jgi:hypothetical protein